MYSIARQGSGWLHVCTNIVKGEGLTSDKASSFAGMLIEFMI